MTTWLIEHDGDWYHRWSKFDWEKCEDGVWKFISPEHREVMEQLFKENYNEWCAKAEWWNTEDAEAWSDPEMVAELYDFNLQWQKMRESESE